MLGRVNILLSTFNGEKYLAQQLDSILTQSYPEIVINIRDDGSTDDTTQLLRTHYVNRYLNINFTAGSNLGVVKSFFTLLQNSKDDCEYFAFCDQDDIWPNNKIYNAVTQLKAYNSEQPLLYCSRLEYVSEDLTSLGYSNIPKYIGFRNSLVENIATGCTVVINRKARDLILEKIPSNVLMHDWWFYIVISAFGKVLFDINPNIKYRQHGNNLVGGSSSIFRQYIRRLNSFMKRERGALKASGQAKEFFRCYGSSLKKDELKILNGFLMSKSNLRSRIAYVLRMGVSRQSIIDNLILRFLIIIDRY